MRCRMCNAVEARQNEEELNLEDLRRLASVLSKMGVGFLIITGGEPLLYKNIVEAVNIFNEAGISVRIQSNGLLFTREKLKELKDAGLDGITISLHSLSKEKMEFITNIPDALQKIFKAMHLYTEVFPSKNHIRGLNMVVSAFNIEEAPCMVEFATRIGYTVSLIPVHLSRDKDFIVRREEEKFFFNETHFSVIDRVYKELISMKKKGYNIYNSKRFLQETPEFLKHGKTSWRCESPDLYFSISPSGTFLPCVDLNGRRSMLDPDFLSSWKTKSFRDEIKEQVLNCKGCMYACYPEFSYIFYDKTHFIKRFFDYRRMNAVEARPLTVEKLKKELEGLCAEKI